MSDVPVGAFFSGGIDSCAVAAFAKRAGRPVRCFGVHFTGPGRDRRAPVPGGRGDGARAAARADDRRQPQLSGRSAAPHLAPGPARHRRGDDPDVPRQQAGRAPRQGLPRRPGRRRDLRRLRALRARQPGARPGIVVRPRHRTDGRRRGVRPPRRRQPAEAACGREEPAPARCDAYEPDAVLERQVLRQLRAGAASTRWRRVFPDERVLSRDRAREIFEQTIAQVARTDAGRQAAALGHADLPDRASSTRTTG